VAWGGQAFIFFSEKNHKLKGRLPIRTISQYAVKRNKHPAEIEKR